MAGESVSVAGTFEHPTREAPEKPTMQLHAEVAAGALRADGDLPFNTDGGGLCSNRLRRISGGPSNDDQLRRL